MFCYCFEYSNIAYTLFCVNVASVLSITEKVVLKCVQCVMKRFYSLFVL